MNYFRKKATPWVSFSVLAGGLLSACLLFVVTKVEDQFSDWETVETYLPQIEQR